MSDISKSEVRYFLAKEVEVSEAEWMAAVREAKLVRVNQASGLEEPNASKFAHITIDGRRVSGRIERS